MKKIPHTYRTKNGYYYFRLVLPAHIRSNSTTKEIRFSLRTRDYNVAKQRAYKTWLDCYYLISNNKFQSESLHEVIAQMSNNKLMTIQLGETTKELISLSDAAAAYDFEYVKGLLNYLIGTDQELFCKVASHDVMIYPLLREVDSDGREIEKTDYCSADKVKEFNRPEMVVLTKQAIQSIADSQNDRFCIEEYKTYDFRHWSKKNGFIKISEPLEAINTSIYKIHIDNDCYEKIKDFSIPSSGANSVDTASDFKLTQAWEDFLSSSDWRDKTREENTKIFELFVEIVGDINIQDVSYTKHLLPFKEVISRLPPNRNKGKYKEISAVETANLNHAENGKVLNHTTLIKYGSRISSFLEYYKDNGTISVNPARKLFPKKKSDPKHDRDPITDDELCKIFNSKEGIALFSKKDSLRKPSRLWGMLLLAYTGARKEEIFTLTTDDVNFNSEAPFISFNENGHGKHLKNKSSARDIPIHPHLIKLGLKEYVRKSIVIQRGLKTNQLFPELNPSEKHGYGRAPSHWFRNTLLSELKIKNRKKVTHSLRHSVADKLVKNTKVRQFFIDSYLGHRTGRSMSQMRYGSELTPAELAKILKHIDFGLDLSLIKSVLNKTKPIKPRKRPQ